MQSCSHTWASCATSLVQVAVVGTVGPPYNASASEKASMFRGSPGGPIIDSTTSLLPTACPSCRDEVPLAQLHDDHCSTSFTPEGC